MNRSVLTGTITLTYMAKALRCNYQIQCKYHQNIVTTFAECSLLFLLVLYPASLSNLLCSSFLQKLYLGNQQLRGKRAS